MASVIALGRCRLIEINIQRIMHDAMQNHRISFSHCLQVFKINKENLGKQVSMFDNNNFSLKLNKIV